MDILKIAVLGIVGALLGIMLKEQKKEYELFATLGVSLCIFYFIMSKLELVLSVINQMQDYVRLDAGYLAILIKMIANLDIHRGRRPVSTGGQRFVLPLHNKVRLADMDAMRALKAL